MLLLWRGSQGTFTGWNTSHHTWLYFECNNLVQLRLWKKEIRVCIILLVARNLAWLWQSLSNALFLLSQNFKGFFPWCHFSSKMCAAGWSTLCIFNDCTLLLLLLTSILKCDWYPVSFFLVHHHGSKMLRSESNSSITTTQPTIGWQPLSLALPLSFSLFLLLHSCFNHLFYCNMLHCLWLNSNPTVSWCFQI